MAAGTAVTNRYFGSWAAATTGRDPASAEAPVITKPGRRIRDLLMSTQLMIIAPWQSTFPRLDQQDYEVGM
jgi:hypothetical protein